MLSEQLKTDTFLYCDICFARGGKKIPLELVVLEINTWSTGVTKADTDYVDNFTKSSVPTFNIELGTAEVEYKPEFRCPNCQQTCWILNNNITYSDDLDELYIPCFNDSSILGWDKPTPPDPSAPLKIQHLRDFEV